MVEPFGEGEVNYLAVVALAVVSVIFIFQLGFGTTDRVMYCRAEGITV